MDRDTWSGQYRKLCAAYGKPLSAEQAGIYFDALQDIPNERIGRAVIDVIGTSKFWPAPAVIREQAELIAAAEFRSMPARIPVGPQMSAEQTAALMQMIRETREKLFGRMQ